jgi:hypothetical protein
VKRLLLQHCWLALGFLSLGIAALPARPSAEHPFPMSPGTCWVYRGTVLWTHDTNQSSETRVTWKAEIKRVIQRGESTAAVISGFPSDLNWTDGHPTPSDSLLVEASGKFYFISADRFQDAVKRLEQPFGTLDGFLTDNDLILEWPLNRGQKYCDSDSLARQDNMYCWSRR